MRKLALSLLLPLLMLLSQQGAVWHEIGHLSGEHSSHPGGNSLPPDDVQKQHPIEKLCESCLAFAHLSAAAKPEVFALALADLHCGVAIAQFVAMLAAEVPAQRSRGPPRVF